MSIDDRIEELSHEFFKFFKRRILIYILLIICFRLFLMIFNLL